MDDASVYGFGRNQYIHHGAHVGLDGATVFHFRAGSEASRRFTHYRAFAIDRPAAGAEKQPAKAAAKRRRAAAKPAKQYRWTTKLPVLARAMLLAGDTLFLAGPPDFFATDDPAGALEGKRGGTLMAVSTSNGQSLAEYPLESPPVFDGLAAARGRLYLATADGQVTCYGPDK